MTTPQDADVPATPVLMSDASTSHLPIPTGFVELPSVGPAGFNTLCGPIWIKAESDSLVGGFRVEQRHCNPSGNCHGGMIATFCDLHLAMAAIFQARLAVFLIPTINLSVDYLAPTLIGAWVEARAEIAKITRGMVFVNEIVMADGEPVARANAIYKIPSADITREGITPRDTGAFLREWLQR